MTKEHIIPESLGGKLFSIFLCKMCNDNFGLEVENAAKKDPSIRLAVERLKERIPKVALSLSDGQTYIASSVAGKVKGWIKKGKFMVFTKKKEDGSLVQSMKDARKTIRNIILKTKQDEDVIQQALNEFEAAPDGKPIQLCEDLKVIKWSLTGLQPSLSGERLDILVPVKMAFEYIACHVGTSIYSKSEPVMQVKHALLSRNRVSKCYNVEFLHAADYAPFHGLGLEENGPPAIVQIRLFGFLAYRVKFPHIEVQGPRYIYTQYLDRDQEFIGERLVNGKT